MKLSDNSAVCFLIQLLYDYFAIEFTLILNTFDVTYKSKPRRNIQHIHTLRSPVSVFRILIGSFNYPPIININYNTLYSQQSTRAVTRQTSVDRRRIATGNHHIGKSRTRHEVLGIVRQLDGGFLAWCSSLIPELKRLPVHCS